METGTSAGETTFGVKHLLLRGQYSEAVTEKYIVIEIHYILYTIEYYIPIS